MDLQDAINQRHSIRQFTNKPVEKKMITKIVELAQRAPSWVNSQPWQVYCAMGDTLQAIKNAYRDQDIAGNQGNSDLPVMSREDWAPQTQDNMKQWRHGIVHPPVILYITIPKASPDWSIFDAGLFAENIMLAATAYGLGTIPTYNSVRFSAILHQTLNVPDDERFIVGISLGYSADTTINSYHSERRPVNEILHFN